MNRLKTIQTSLQGNKQSSSLSDTKNLLCSNLYSICPVNSAMSKQILSRVYSPGVGAVCKAIEKNPSLANSLTLRGRSVAIVSDGTFINGKNKSVHPVMDWLIVQIKYFSGLDAFPFVLKQESEEKDIRNLNQVVRDLSTCYGMVLLMDGQKIQKESLVGQVLILDQRDVMEVFGGQIVNLERAAMVFLKMASQNRVGLVTKEQIKKFGQGKPSYIQPIKPKNFEIDNNADLDEDSMKLHKTYQGKIRVQLNFNNIDQLKPHFTIEKLQTLVKQQGVYSKSGKLTAIVTDGTAILGFGNIGPLAGLPVMQGKSLLFHKLGNVQVVPVCIYPRATPREQIESIRTLLGNYYAINLEDIKAPECFQIQTGLQQLKEMPVFHDDQHGTAIVVLAGLINATKCAQKKLKQCKVVINGAGAAGITIAKMLVYYGVTDIIVCDSIGAIYKGRQKNMNASKTKLAEVTNLRRRQGQLKEILQGADVFVGVSVQNALKGAWVARMNNRSIVFALANPIPQIMLEQAKNNGVYIYGSGRSNFENQINNSLAFPGIFMAIIKHEIKEITEAMKIKAAQAIAASLSLKLTPQYIIPEMLDNKVAVKICEELGKLNLPKKHNNR